MSDEIMLAGKPLSQFYQLPFEPDTRILQLSVVESHTQFRSARNPYYQLDYREIAFKKGVLITDVRINKGSPVKVYFKVEYDHLLVSCSVDTDANYLGKYAYRTLHHIMWYNAYNFEKYYWPDCFDERTGRSKYLHVIADRYGVSIKRKENFKGFFKPGDKFVALHERQVMERSSSEDTALSEHLRKDVGYCLANTDLTALHSLHFPLLIPYRFIANADQKTVKTFRHFVFETNAQSDDTALSTDEAALDRICFAMMKIATIEVAQDGDTAARLEKIKLHNCHNRLFMYILFQHALPLLVAAPFTHYRYTHGLKNIHQKIIKKDMQIASFSMEIPRLLFVLADQGDYYELRLLFKIQEQVMTFCEWRNATFFICSAANPELWYLLEADLDTHVVAFFYKKNFKIQIPKSYYPTHFAHYVEELKKYYPVEYK